MIAGGAVQPEADLAGQVQPDGDLLFLAGAGKGLGQPLEDLAAQQLAEQVGLERLGDRLQVVYLAAAQGLDDEVPVLFEDDQVHARLRFLLAGPGGGSRRAFSSRSTAARICRWSWTRRARVCRNWR